MDPKGGKIIYWREDLKKHEDYSGSPRSSRDQLLVTKKKKKKSPPVRDELDKLWLRHVRRDNVASKNGAVR